MYLNMYRMTKERSKTVLTNSYKRAVKHVFKMRWHTPYARYLWNGDVMYGNPTERRYGPKKISFTTALAQKSGRMYAREVYGESMEASIPGSVEEEA